MKMRRKRVGRKEEEESLVKARIYRGEGKHRERVRERRRYVEKDEDKKSERQAGKERRRKG
jgi:hypothetical protein